MPFCKHVCLTLRSAIFVTWSGSAAKVHCYERLRLVPEGMSMPTQFHKMFGEPVLRDRNWIILRPGEEKVWLSDRALPLWLVCRPSASHEHVPVNKTNDRASPAFRVYQSTQSQEILVMSRRSWSGGEAAWPVCKHR